MDHTGIPMSDNARTLIDFAESTTRRTVLVISSSGHGAELNGRMQKNFCNDVVEKGGTKQHYGEGGMEHHAVQHGHGNEDWKTENEGANVAPNPAIPAMDSAVRERLRLSLEHNMPELSDMCFSIPNELQSPNVNNSGRNGRGKAESLNSAADDAYVIPNRPRLFVPFHVMEAVYGKPPVPMQSYDNHASMLPLSREHPSFLPPPLPMVRAHCPTSPSGRRNRPPRRTGSPTQRRPQNPDGLGARSLEETPGRKFAAMLGRCTAAASVVPMGDLLDAHKKITDELERRGVIVGLGPRPDDGREAAGPQNGQGQTSSTWNGSSMKLISSNNEASAKTDDPFTE